MRERDAMPQTRVLIVHPDPSVGALMTSMLQALGHRIDEAPNDRAAVRMLEHAPVDLVLAGSAPTRWNSCRTCGARARSFR